MFRQRNDNGSEWWARICSSGFWCQSWWRGKRCLNPNGTTDTYGIIYHRQDIISLALVALLTSATRDVEPEASFSEIYYHITRSGATSHLIRTWFKHRCKSSWSDWCRIHWTCFGPVLLPCNDPTARDIMVVIGECGSAKDVVMAVQEAIEQLATLGDSIKFKESLKGSLNWVIISCGNCICASIAQRTFELCYPRLIIRSSQQSGWEEGEMVILDAIVSCAILLLNFLV